MENCFILIWGLNFFQLPTERFLDIKVQSYQTRNFNFKIKIGSGLFLSL